MAPWEHEGGAVRATLDVPRQGGDTGAGIPASPWACATLIQGDFGVKRCFLEGGST